MSFVADSLSLLDSHETDQIIDRVALCHTRSDHHGIRKTHSADASSPRFGHADLGLLLDFEFDLLGLCDGAGEFDLLLFGLCGSHLLLTSSATVTSC